LYTDPHLGVNRTQNTTPASRRLLRSCISKTVHDILDIPGEKVCLGDLFDTYSNSEDIIRDGGNILSRTSLTIAGNHDIVADADKVGSLQLLNYNYLGSEYVDVVMGRFNEVVVDTSIRDGHLMVAVPHHTTQDLFEQALDKANQSAADYDYMDHTLKILLLHCNYNLGFATEETSLNLDYDTAKGLLDTFDYVVVGHEHNQSEHFDGRLIVLGNVHPTGFADLSDKRILKIEPDGSMEYQTVWSASRGVAEYLCDDIPEETGAQFVTVGGELEPGSLAQVARGVRKLWKNSPGLIALRLTYETSLEVGLKRTETSSLQTLPDKIRHELGNRPDLKALWEEFTDGSKS